MLACFLCWWDLAACLRQADKWAIAGCLVSHGSLGLTITVIGWALYPFWVNGIYQVYLGSGRAFPLSSYDPRGFFPIDPLIPAWQLSVCLLALGCFVAVPVLLCSILMLLGSRRDLRGGFLAAAGLTVLIAVWITIPDFYFTWLID